MYIYLYIYISGPQNVIRMGFWLEEQLGKWSLLRSSSGPCPAGRHPGRHPGHPCGPPPGPHRGPLRPSAATRRPTSPSPGPGHPHFLCSCLHLCIPSCSPPSPLPLLLPPPSIIVCVQIHRAKTNRPPPTRAKNSSEERRKTCVRVYEYLHECSYTECAHACSIYTQACMHLSMQLYVCIGTSLQINHTHAHHIAYQYAHTYIYIYIYIYAHTYTRIQVYTHVYIFIYIYVCRLVFVAWLLGCSAWSPGWLPGCSAWPRVSHKLELYIIQIDMNPVGLIFD